MSLAASPRRSTGGSTATAPPPDIRVRSLERDGRRIGLLVDGVVTDLPGRCTVTVMVQLDTGGEAVQYKFNLHGPEGGTPRVMWHRMPGHEHEDGTDCHVHHRGQPRLPDKSRTFSRLTVALDAELTA